MKRILVGIKRVVDYNVRHPGEARWERASSPTGSKMSINPFDEIALEEALRIKERGVVEEVIVATVGPADCQQQLRTALAMGGGIAPCTCRRTVCGRAAHCGAGAAEAHRARAAVAGHPRQTGDR